jgi:signal transduction histidine kinase
MDAIVDHNQPQAAARVASSMLLELARCAVLLAVQDDGRASASAVAGSEGLGLRAMRFRAERLGGRLAAGARPEGGWRVECRFPLRAPSEAAI